MSDDTGYSENDVLITTLDNPWNPFTNFMDWYKYDRDQLGYCTWSYLCRVARINDDTMSDAEIDKEYERAIDEIIANDFLNMYYKVTPSTWESIVHPNSNTPS